MSLEKLESVAAALRKRNWEVTVVSTAEEARDLVLKEAASAKSVGWGGSETLKESGIRDALSNGQWQVLDHALIMDLFLLSANALTADGRIVNIDGTGNRIAASITGPKRTVYIIGRNKIVEGGLDEAIARIKSVACPKNARRLGRQTPCALTGQCADCQSPERMCKVTAFFDYMPKGCNGRVILVDQDLGY